ncbi:glycosyltransferase family 2 protein [Bradyrhizobium glycinis]|uniref:glycosyltransferase family 2 protein n=1 Tax=Bradyrhizobium glycinis TaxID=2751812 RepID=UPI001AED1F08|nr:glycosyltransferase family 2 protein [Bradyrhizobium glycinis]
MTELVSVIVPAFNAGRFIAGTLAAALAQTYENLEVIVIDDGSVDNTRSLVETMACNDRRLLLFSTPNRGVARARNLGIANARGHYVAFLDADDLWHPLKVERQVEALNIHRSDPTWAGVYSFHRTIDENDRITGRGQLLVDCRGYILARDLVLKFIGNGSNLLVRRDAALAVGGFDPSYADNGIGGCEDLDFELRLAARYRIELVGSFLVGYRRYKGNMSSDGSRMARAMIETVARHLKANPAISRRVKRWATGSAHRYAFQVLLRQRHMLPALVAYIKLVLNDPIVAIITAGEVVAAVAERFRSERSFGSRLTFLSADPAADSDMPIDTIAFLKQGRLTDEDRMLERDETLCSTELRETIDLTTRGENTLAASAAEVQHRHVQEVR